MMSSPRVFLSLIVIGAIVSPAPARQWTDATGAYTLEADLVGFDDERVILQRENKELGSIAINDLSEQDRKYLESKEAKQLHDSNIGATQIWTSKRGLKISGRIVDYALRNITVQRRRGKIYVNQTVYENLPEIYQAMLPGIVEHFESVPIPDKAAFQKWVLGLRGQPRNYDLQGVILELENGDEYEVPFFLFVDTDQAILRPGWDAWLAEQEDYDKQDDHAFQLQAQAAAYHKDQQVQQQIAIMNLNANLIRAGLVKAWEVTLYPAAGNPNPPRWVVVSGQNSEVAKQNALRENPGYVEGPIRKLSR